MHLLEASQNDLNWHVSIHWIVEAEEGLCNFPNSWLSVVLLHSSNDLWGYKRPKSCGSQYDASCVVRFFNRIFKDGYKGCIHVVQLVAAILLDLPPLLGDALSGVYERACWDIMECAHIQCVNTLLRGQQSIPWFKELIASKMFKPRVEYMW